MGFVFFCFFLLSPNTGVDRGKDGMVDEGAENAWRVAQAGCIVWDGMDGGWVA